MDNDVKKTNTLPDNDSHPTLLSKEAAIPETKPMNQSSATQTSASHLATETNTDPTPDAPLSPENEEILVDISSIYQPTYSGATSNSSDASTASMPIPQQMVLPTREPVPEVKPISEVVVKPKEKIVYKERGGGIIGDMFWRLFNCMGCLLFLVGLLIISLAYWINF
jgi:hypothetical protein